MCGIAGYITFEETPTKEELTTLFKEIESRGSDSSGYAYIEDDVIVINKQPIPATDIVETEEWKNLELPNVMIMHTRAMTQGDKHITINNHPIYNEEFGNRFALVHNGIISNYDDLGIDNDTVDSMAILKSVYDKYDNSIEGIQEVTKQLSGGQAVALLDVLNPNQLTLWRHTNPLWLGFDFERQIIFFASQENFLRKTVTKYRSVGGYSLKLSMSVIELDNDTALIVDKDTLKEGTIETKAYKPIPYYYDHHGAYNKKESIATYYDYVICDKCGGITKTIIDEKDNYHYPSHCEVCGREMNIYGIKRVKPSDYLKDQLPEFKVYYNL